MDLRNLVKSKIGTNKKQEISKDNLEKIITKRMQTIMIGALASVEQHLGFLWGKDDITRQKTPEEKEIESIFLTVRAEILDKGNTQKRAMVDDLQLYNIELINKVISLPILPQG